MKERKKRETVFSLFFGKNRMTPVRYEDELTLHLSKYELFDRQVLLPHAELNAGVYSAVDRFTERYSGDRMTLTVFCDAVSEAVQQTFREVYISHYEDEYRKVTLYLYRRYCRVILLLIVSMIAYYLGNFWDARMERESFLLEALMNMGVFCIWEIGYTHFQRNEASEKRKRIIRARNAEIVFHVRGMTDRQ